MDGAPRARYFRRRLQFAVRVRSGCIRYEQTESSGTFLRGDGEQCFGCVCMCTCVRTGSRGEARERRWQTATDIASLAAAAAATAATKTTTDSCWIIRDEREHRRRNYDAGIQRRQEYTKSASSPELSLRVRERERRAPRRRRSSLECVVRLLLLLSPSSSSFSSSSTRAHER